MPHAIIVPAGMLIVMFVIDRLNQHIYFLENEFHKWLLFIVSVLGIVESVWFYNKSAHPKKGGKHEQKKQKRRIRGCCWRSWTAY